MISSSYVSSSTGSAGAGTKPRGVTLELESIVRTPARNEITGKRPWLGIIARVAISQRCAIRRDDRARLRSRAAQERTNETGSDEWSRRAVQVHRTIRQHDRRFEPPAPDTPDHPQKGRAGSGLPLTRQSAPVMAVFSIWAHRWGRQSADFRSIWTAGLHRFSRSELDPPTRDWNHRRHRCIVVICGRVDPVFLSFHIIGTGRPDSQRRERQPRLCVVLRDSAPARSGVRLVEACWWVRQATSSDCCSRRRLRAIELLQRDIPVHVVAERLGVDRRSVRRWKRARSAQRASCQPSRVSNGGA